MYLISNSCFLAGYTQVSSPSSLTVSPSPESKMQTGQGKAGCVAEYTARIPQRAMMSSMHKLWESVIQGQQNKAANRDSKYITAPFSPPELNWQC